MLSTRINKECVLCAPCHQSFNYIKINSVNTKCMCRRPNRKILLRYAFKKSRPDWNWTKVVSFLRTTSAHKQKEMYAKNLPTLFINNLDDPSRYCIIQVPISKKCPTTNHKSWLFAGFIVQMQLSFKNLQRHSFGCNSLKRRKKKWWYKVYRAQTKQMTTKNGEFKQFTKDSIESRFDVNVSIRKKNAAKLRETKSECTHTLHLVWST